MTQNLINTSLLPFGIPVTDPTGQALSAITMDDAELLIGATSSPIAAVLLLAGANITLTPGAGSVTIAASGGGGGSTISGIVATRRGSSGNHTFNANMVCCWIEAFGAGGAVPQVRPRLTGAGPPYPINVGFGMSGGDGGAYVKLFGTRAQLGNSVLCTVGVRGPATPEGIDPYFAATLSPPPDQAVYNNRAGGSTILTFNSGIVVTVPGGDGGRQTRGPLSTDASSLPFIAPEGAVASQRWGNPSLPTSTDPSIIIIAGSNGPGSPAIGVGTGTGASDVRALCGGYGGSSGPFYGIAGQGHVTAYGAAIAATTQNLVGLGGGGSALGDLTRTSLVGVPTSAQNGTVAIFEYIS